MQAPGLGDNRRVGRLVNLASLLIGRQVETQQGVQFF